MEKVALKENVVSRHFREKPGLLKSIHPVSRPALGEVGNKLTLPTHHGAAKKDAHLPLFKKPVNVKPVTRIAADADKPKLKDQGARKILVPKENRTVKQEECKLVSLLKDKVVITHTEQSYSSKQLVGIIDVDESNDDPTLVAEYIKDIIKYLLELESKFNINQGFLGVDHKSSSHMRSVLVNWMSEVNCNFEFLPETFHLSVATVDRYLQANKNIGRESLQLVGAAAMLIAAKYEEMYIPDLTDFVYICDDSFTKREILKMECDILRRLDFSFGKPLSLHFLRRFNKVAQAGNQHHTLGKYFLELGLLDYDMCHIKPSLQAAAACCLALSVMNDVPNPSEVWTNTLVHYSSYSFVEIKLTLFKFVLTVSKMETSKYTAIRKKYASSKLEKISCHPKLRGQVMQRLLRQAKIIIK